MLSIFIALMIFEVKNSVNVGLFLGCNACGIQSKSNPLEMPQVHINDSYPAIKWVVYCKESNPENQESVGMMIHAPYGGYGCFA